MYIENLRSVFSTKKGVASVLELDKNGDNETDALAKMNGTSHIISNMTRLIQREAEALVECF